MRGEKVEKTTDSELNGKNVVKRRKRVKRMKIIIVVTVLILMILPMICCVFLSIRVNGLEKQVNDLLLLQDDYKQLIQKNEMDLKYTYAVANPVKDEQDVQEDMTEQASEVNIPQTQKVIPQNHEVIHQNNEVIPQNLGVIPQNNEVIPQNHGGYGIEGTTERQIEGVISPEAKIHPTPVSLAVENPIEEQPAKINSGQSGEITSGEAAGKNVNVNNDVNGDNGANTELTEDNKQTQQPSEETKNVVADVEQSNKDPKQLGEIASSSVGIYAGKKVYLTFDDGPSIYSEKILDILAKYKVKATFFVVGKTDASSKKIYKRIVDEGHTLGMHSYSHVYKQIYKSIEDFDKDFTKLWELLYDTTGYKPTIYRFPGGSSNLVNDHGMDEFIRYLSDKSIVYYDWNVLSGDAEDVEYTNEQLIDNVLNGVAIKKRSIVLMHDVMTKGATVDTLPALLEALINGGAQILPLDEAVPPIQQIKANSID